MLFGFCAYLPHQVYASLQSPRGRGKWPELRREGRDVIQEGRAEDEQGRSGMVYGTEGRYGDGWESRQGKFKIQS